METDAKNKEKKKKKENHHPTNSRYLLHLFHTKYFVQGHFVKTELKLKEQLFINTIMTLQQSQGTYRVLKSDLFAWNLNLTALNRP